MDVFFSDDDRTRYLGFLTEYGRLHGVTYIAWCLMDNHVHLVVVPEESHSLAKGIGEAHKRYTRDINKREGWTGYLFQGRFFSCPIEPTRLLGVVHYVLRNPVRARLADNAWKYRWSSARWLVGDSLSDLLVTEKGPLTEVDDWRLLLAADGAEDEHIRKHTTTGRPIGSKLFADHIGLMIGRDLRKTERGHIPESGS